MDSRTPAAVSAELFFGGGGGFETKEMDGRMIYDGIHCSCVTEEDYLVCMLYASLTHNGWCSSLLLLFFFVFVFLNKKNDILLVMVACLLVLMVAVACCALSPFKLEAMYHLKPDFALQIAVFTL